MEAETGSGGQITNLSLAGDWKGPGEGGRWEERKGTGGGPSGSQIAAFLAPPSTYIPHLLSSALLCSHALMLKASPA